MVRPECARTLELGANESAYIACSDPCQPAQRAAAPPISFFVQNDRLYLYLRSDDRHSGKDVGLNPSTVSTRRVPIGRVPFDKWICFIVRANWSTHPGQGALSVWRDREGIYWSKNDANAYPSQVGYNPRVGLYAPGGLGASQRELFADFIWVGDETTRHDQMLARTPCAAAR